MQRDSSARWGLLLLFLAAGLLLRAGIFGLPHREGDERIYGALIDQVRAGHGYTLQGHPILTEDWMIAEQYDTPLFYHPPAGVAWMALLGPDVAQLAAFAIFLAATWGLARETLPRWDGVAATTVGLLAATTPIVAHVSMHRWLDGPQVAATALAAWLLTRALRGGGALAAACAGAAIGVALLVKLNAALALPGIAALAWVAASDRPRAERARLLAVAAIVAGLAVLPWLIVAPPTWAGKPSARLVALNPFIRQITEGRSAWAYLRLLPTTVWTLAPSAVLLALLRPAGRTRAVALALGLWIAVVTGSAMILGGIGYSKLLRYVVLVAPATILLAALAVTEARRLAKPGWTWVLVLAIALELAHGARTVLVFPDRAWIRPLVGAPR